MPRYLVETYLSRCLTAAGSGCEERARAAAAELNGAGTRIRFGGVIHVPEDEICFFVFDAPSSADAALVAERAALAPLRVVEAVTSEEE
jgi:hypothetical protein